MTRAPRIAIVRGGVGGLAAALALQRHGTEIVVCEQSPALNEIGAGLNLSPNALMALRVLGVEDAVVALGCESDFLTIRSWKSGRIISRMRRGAFRLQFGAPHLSVHRRLARRAAPRAQDGRFPSWSPLHLTRQRFRPRGSTATMSVASCNKGKGSRPGAFFPE